MAPSKKAVRRNIIPPTPKKIKKTSTKQKPNSNEVVINQNINNSQTQNKNAKFAVEMEVFDWHSILKELEFAMCIVGRDTDHIKDLWEQIATQLSNCNRIYYGSKQHRELFPSTWNCLGLIKEEKKEAPSKSEEPKKRLGVLDTIKFWFT